MSPDNTSTVQPVTRLPEKTPLADAKPDQPAKSASKSHDLLVGTARFVRRTVEKALYQQFVDADSDDVDKEPVVAGSNTLTVNQSRGDSSSEGPDVAERDKYQQQRRFRDFRYQELEDEYGSKRSTKPSVQPYQQEVAFGGGGGSDVSNGMEPDSSERSHDDDGYEEASPKLPTHHLHSLSPPGQQVMPPGEQHDRIVGHEFGVKPLLDDDELSDTEGGKPSVTMNPFLAQDEELSQCSSVMSTGSVTMSPQSSLSPVDVATRDVFGAAPFRQKSRKKRSKLLLGSPPQSGPVTPSVFTESLSDMYRSVSTAGQELDCVVEKGKDERVGASIMAHSLSPDTTVMMRSASQSPKDNTNKDIPMQVRSPAAATDNDLFGFRNFATFTTSQPPQPVVCLQHQGAAQYTGGKVTSPNSRTMTSVSFEMDPFGVTPFIGDSFHADLTRAHLMSGSATRNKADLRVQSSNYSTGHGVASCGMHRQHRRHSSSDSHSSSSDISPHSTKKDSQKISKCYSKGSDLLQDENVEVLPSGDFSYASLKKSKQKAKKTAKPSAEFANLGFMDDTEREAELAAAARKCSGNVELPVNSAMHQSLMLDPLKSSNIGNYMSTVDGGGATSSGSSHTLPRARKHLVMPEGHRNTDKMSTEFFQ